MKRSLRVKLLTLKNFAMIMFAGFVFVFGCGAGCESIKTGDTTKHEMEQTWSTRYFPAIPVLAPDASVDAIAVRSDLELARTKMFALVAQAEAQHYATIHALKLSAAATVSKLTTGALAILGGFVITTIASGATL